jgi:hypothetical protein
VAGCAYAHIAFYRKCATKHPLIFSSSIVASLYVYYIKEHNYFFYPPEINAYEKLSTSRE